jgi:hypothetical protein
MSETVTIHVPIRFSLRGGRKTIISEVSSSLPQARIDNALLNALARAHRWRRQIENGEYASITELAQAKKVNQSYACRLLRLTLLAPDVITKILDRRPASHLLLKDLTKPFPIEWNAQRIAISGLAVYINLAL